MYKRKTRDEYDLEMYTGYGWEVVTCEDTRSEILKRKREYLENAPEYHYRIMRHRVPVTPEVTL